MPPVQGTPTNICINLTLQETKVLFYIFVADIMGLSSFKFSWYALKDKCFVQCIMAVHSHPMSVTLATNDTKLLAEKTPIFHTPLSFNTLARGEPLRISG